jgi:hypothetical protein
MRPSMSVSQARIIAEVTDESVRFDGRTLDGHFGTVHLCGCASFTSVIGRDLYLGEGEWSELCSDHAKNRTSYLRL